MKNSNNITFVLLFLTSLSWSCVSVDQMSYLKNSKIPGRNIISVGDQSSITPSEYRILPFDILYIRVLTPDPQWSELFNTLPVGAGGAVTEESASLFGYPVDVDGSIEIPFVGRMIVGGKTLSEIKTELELVFSKYLTDHAITVRLVNNFISVFGEVNAPGRYRLTKDRLNVFEALAMAGDMSTFSNRQRVQLIRPSPSGPVINEFSLSDRNILSSDFFYVMPNDLIYVMPIRGRTFQINASVYSLFLSAISTALVVFGFIRTF